MITIARKYQPDRRQVVFDTRLLKEPRLNQAHLEAMRKIVQSDHEARFCGFDKRMRPVVETVANQKRVRYALMRNGDPASVDGGIAEIWR